MIPIQSNQLTFAQLFDALPNTVVYLKAVYNAQGDVVDFVFDYANPSAQHHLAVSYGITVGMMVRSTSTLPERTFFELCTVLETGQSTEVDYFNTTLNEWLLVTRTKAGDGVLSMAHITTTEKQIKAELHQQNSLLQRILDSSLSNIFVYEAIRHDSLDGQPGAIYDFSIRLINKVGRQYIIDRMGIDPLGSTLLSVNPNSRELGQFNLFCQVIETGQAIQTEQFYPAAEVWFNTTITKMNDGCVVTGIDITAQKQTALANQQQAELFNSVLDGSANGITAFEAVYDPKGNIVDFLFLAANEAACQLFGKSSDELIGQRMLTLYPGNASSGLFARYIHTVRTGESFITEVDYQLDGLSSWYEVSGQKFDNGLVITFRDLQQTKQLQQAIEQHAVRNQQQADLLNSVLDSSNSGIIAFEAIRDLDSRIIDFKFILSNRASVAMVGKTMDEMIGHRLLALFPGNIESGLFDLYKHTTETGEPGRQEVYYNHDGLDFWIDVSTQQLGDGFVVTFTDVSVVKRAAQLAEQAALMSEQQTELLNTVLNNSQTAISLHEAIRDSTTGQIIDFRTILANRRATAMWGDMAEAIMSQTFLEVANPEQLAIDFQKYVHVVETGEPDLSEFNVEEKWLLRLTAKSNDGVVISNIDITQIHQLQQQLETSIIDLQRSNANLEQFAYVASHDLQEPLRKIQAFGDMIESQYAPVMGSQGTALIKRMQSAAARMQVLIKDVLAYSRIATRRENVGLVNLNQVCDEVLENLETAIGTTNALITIETLPTLTGDLPQLRQLLQNLLSNSLKFAKPNTTPQIKVASHVVRGRDAYMTILPSDANRLFHLIELQDNGIGFERQYAERIFQVFQRLHSRNNYEGTGIGLAIVQKVVENHQGYIEAEGKPDEGATFRILLPVTS